MSDKRRENAYYPRKRTDRDQVYEEDDWKKGFSRYHEYKERLRRERDREPDMTWDAYVKYAKSRGRGYDQKEEVRVDDYAEAMASYRRDFRLFLEDKIDVPPPKPPWFPDVDKRSGRRSDYRAIDSDEELSISGSLGGFSYHSGDDPLEPGYRQSPSVPSWARSEKQGSDKKSTHSKTSGSKAKPSVETKKDKPVMIENSDTQFKAALMELLAKVVDKGTDNSRPGGNSGGYKTKITSISCDKWSGDSNR